MEQTAKRNVINQIGVKVSEMMKVLMELYSDKAKAFAHENLQNSLDAGAKVVNIDIDPGTRRINWEDNGTGVPLSLMTRESYFTFPFTTKGGGAFIGNKGIGRLINQAVAGETHIESRHKGQVGRFCWFESGSWKELDVKPGKGEQRPHGFSLELRNVHGDLFKSLPNRIRDAACVHFADHIRKNEVHVFLNGKELKPHEYVGKRRSFRLKHGAALELFYKENGQPEDDIGIVRKCRGVRVDAKPSTLNVRTGDPIWKNVAGVLHLDNFILNTNREEFVVNSKLESVQEQARAIMFTYMAEIEGTRFIKGDRHSDLLTQAARKAAKELGMAVAWVQARKPPHKDDVEKERRILSKVKRHKPRRGKDRAGANADTNTSRKSTVGPDFGFNVHAADFRYVDDLKDVAGEMTTLLGSTVFINTGLPGYPKAPAAQPFYEWYAVLTGLIKAGTLGDLTQDGVVQEARLVSVLEGWALMRPASLSKK